MESHDPQIERRQFPRIRAPILWRPVGPPTSGTPLIDISLGGLRVHSDEPTRAGDRREIEIFLRDRRTVTALVEVAWCRELPEGSQAAYDVGLRFVDLSPEGLELLSTMLMLEESDQTPS